MGGWVFKSLKSVFKLPNRYIKYFKLALPEYRSCILLRNCVSDVLWRSKRNEQLLLLTDSMLYAKSPKREGKRTVNKLSEDELRNVILAFPLQKNLKLVNLLVNVKSNSMTMMARPVTSFT